MQRIIYLRVSKADLKSGTEREQQDLEAQLPPILKKFNLKEKDCIILKEKGSAYDIDKIRNRTEFIEILKFCFKADKTSILDLWIKNYEPQDIELFVFDSNRLMRNIEFGVFFSLLRYWFRVKLFSCNQENLNPLESDTIGIKMSRYLMQTIDSYLAEGYSKNISDAVKKTVTRIGDVTVSSQGNQWAGGLLNQEGKKVSLKTYEQIRNKVRYLRSYFHYSYEEIINKIEEEFKVRPSMGWLSGVLNNGTK